jgi:CheY-like chemotaxis protein
MQLDRIAGARLLLVEDDELNQEIAIDLLTDAGFIVEVAENGKVAVEMIVKGDSRYDLVLMDMQMPEMDGPTAVRLVRQEPAQQDLPIIAMTANALPAHRDLCLAAGMNGHLTKPFDPDDLWKVLVHWIKPADLVDAGKGARVYDSAKLAELCQRLRELLHEQDIRALALLRAYEGEFRQIFRGDFSIVDAHIAAGHMDAARAILDDAGALAGWGNGHHV